MSPSPTPGLKFRRNRSESAKTKIKTRGEKNTSVELLPDPGPFPIPSGYLRITKKEPESKFLEQTNVNGMWISLLKPIPEWPKELREEYQQDLYFLFPKQFTTEAYNSKDLVCLCSTVRNCSKKRVNQLENRACTEYRRGLCIEASIEANECKPLSLGSIARFHGLSKQRVFQIYKEARKHLIAELAHDSTMQEYLADIFIGKRSMPTPEEISNFIEQAIQGKVEDED